MPLTSNYPRRRLSAIVEGQRPSTPQGAHYGDLRQWAGQVVEKVRVASVGGRLRFLPWFDPYSDETPEMRQEYRHMLRESSVKAAFQTKVLSVIAEDVQFQPDNEDDPREKEAASFYAYAFKKLSTVDLGWSILHPAIMDGHSVCEKVWDPEPLRGGKFKGKRLFKYVKAKDTHFLQLGIDPYRNITAIRGTGFNAGRVYSPSDFIIFSYFSLFENPAGMSDFRAAYRPYWIKDTTWKLRSLHLEKWTGPFIVGHYSNQESRAALEEAFDEAKSSTWLTVPQGDVIECLDLAMKGTSDFKDAIADCDREILIAIVGAHLQILEGQTGGARGNTKVHKEIGELIQWWLAAKLADVYREQLVIPLKEENYWDVEACDVSIGAVTDEAMIERLKVYEGMQKLGLKLSQKAAYRSFNMQPPEDPDDVLTAPGAGGQGPGGPAPPGGPPMPPGGPDQGGGGGGGGSPFGEASCFADEFFHGPEPPGPGWVPAGTGPRGGKMWKRQGGKNKSPDEEYDDYEREHAAWYDRQEHREWVRDQLDYESPLSSVGSKAEKQRGETPELDVDASPEDRRRHRDLVAAHAARVPAAFAAAYGPGGDLAKRLAKLGATAEDLAPVLLAAERGQKALANYGYRWQRDVKKHLDAADALDALPEPPEGEDSPEHDAAEALVEQLDGQVEKQADAFFAAWEEQVSKVEAEANRLMKLLRVRIDANAAADAEPQEPGEPDEGQALSEKEVGRGPVPFGGGNRVRRFCTEGENAGKPGPCPEGSKAVHGPAVSAMLAAHPFPRGTLPAAPPGASRPDLRAKDPALDRAARAREEWAQAHSRASIAHAIGRMLGGAPDRPIPLPPAGAAPGRKVGLTKKAIEQVEAASADMAQLGPAYAQHQQAVTGTHEGGATALAAARQEAGRRLEAAAAVARQHVAGLPEAQRAKAEKLLSRALPAGVAKHSEDCWPYGFSEAGWHAFAAASASRKPGEKWQGPSGKWFTKRQDGRVVPTAAPGPQDQGGGKSAPKPAPAPARAAGKADKAKEAAAAKQAAFAAAKAIATDPASAAPEHANAIGRALLTLNVADLQGLKKQLGLKGGDRAKAALVASIKERARAAVVAAGKGKTPAPAPAAKPAPAPAAKLPGLNLPPVPDLPPMPKLEVKRLPPPSEMPEGDIADRLKSAPHLHDAARQMAQLHERGEALRIGQSDLLDQVTELSNQANQEIALAGQAKTPAERSARSARIKQLNDHIDAARTRYREFSEALDRHAGECREHLHRVAGLDDEHRAKIGGHVFEEGAEGAKPGATRATDFLAPLLGRGARGQNLQGYTFFMKPGDDRAFYDTIEHRINAGLANMSTAVGVHEMGHGIENNLHGSQQAAQQFLKHRLAGEQPVRLNTLPGVSGYGDGERGSKDHFDRYFNTGQDAYYVGKSYGTGDTEIVSMGVQALYEDPARFAAADPEYFAFTLGVLRGDLRTPYDPDELII